MVPFMLSAEEEEDPETCAHYLNSYFVAENPTMLFSGTEAQGSHNVEEQDETEESEEQDEMEDVTFNLKILDNDKRYRNHKVLYH